MISLRTTRLVSFPVSTPAPTRGADRPLSARATVTAPLWRSDQVQWGVVRARNAFDLGDTERHAGRVQHAFPLGRDTLAACGFRTPLQRTFDGTKRPLLAMPGASNPACPRCLARVIPPGAPAVGDDLADRGTDAWLRDRLAPEPGAVTPPRPLRPAVAIPVAPAIVGSPVSRSAVSPAAGVPSSSRAAGAIARPRVAPPRV